MPKRSGAIDAMPSAVLAHLRRLGEDLSIARKRRREPLKAWAQRLGVSEPTLMRMEKGDPSACRCVWRVDARPQLEGRGDCLRAAMTVAVSATGTQDPSPDNDECPSLVTGARPGWSRPKPETRMHPDLEKVASELASAGGDQALALRFGLACVEEVAGNLESDEVIAVLEKFRACLAGFGPHSQAELQALAARMANLAASHPGSSSIDGSRHAAVSATYALAKAVSGQAMEAAAYAAYSSVYGYGGYAVSDPEAFAEVHRRQLDRLRALKHAQTGSGS